MRVLLILFLLCAGCAPMVGAQMDLVDQARKGVALAIAAQGEHLQTSDELARLRRLRLDEAFDADVRQRPSLDAQWVIEHRQAYAAGLSALKDAQADAHRAHAVHVANLAATDAALQRARWLLEIQSRWDALFDAPQP